MPLHRGNPVQNGTDMPLQHRNPKVQPLHHIYPYRNSEIKHYAIAAYTAFPEISYFPKVTNTVIPEFNHQSNAHKKPRDQPLQYINPCRNTRDQADFSNYLMNLYNLLLSLYIIFSSLKFNGHKSTGLLFQTVEYMHEHMDI